MAKTLVFAVLLLAAAVAVSATQTKTLVLVDDLELQDTHSLFFKALEKRGHNVTFKLADDENLAIQKFGEYLYDNLIIFSPTVEEFGTGLDVDGILAFIDAGRNVLIAANSDITEPIREIALECGIDVDEQGTHVVDSKNTVSENTIAADKFLYKHIHGSKLSAPVIFNGVGHVLSEDSKRNVKVLYGSSSTQSSKGSGEAPQSQGEDTLLVSVLQARNNARVAFAGSLDMFSDKAFTSAAGKKFEKSGNEQFCNDLAKWTFQETGRIKAVNVKHRLVGSAEWNPSTYRVNDKVEYQVDILEFDSAKNTWVPYVADDIQLEFVMLDPYIRTALKQHGKGHYEVSFQVPDVYGVFQFKLKYERVGVSYLDLATQVKVRPYKHNEFERFITSAFPYYFSAFSMMVGSFVFGFVFLYSKDQ